MSILDNASSATAKALNDVISKLTQDNWKQTLGIQEDFTIKPVPDATFFEPFKMYTGIVAGLDSATMSVVLIAFLLGSVAAAPPSIENQGLPSSRVSLGSSDSPGSLLSSGWLSSGSVVVSSGAAVVAEIFLLSLTI